MRTKSMIQQIRALIPVNQQIRQLQTGQPNDDSLYADVETSCLPLLHRLIHHGADRTFWNIQ